MQHARRQCKGMMAPDYDSLHGGTLSVKCFRWGLFSMGQMLPQKGGAR